RANQNRVYGDQDNTRWLDLIKQHRTRGIECNPSDHRQQTAENREYDIVARQRGRHPILGILSSPRSDNPRDGQSIQAAEGLNTTRSASIEKACSDSVIPSQTREPATGPNPVRKQRIGPCSEQSCGRDARAQSPAISTCAERDRRRKPYADHL